MILGIDVCGPYQGVIDWDKAKAAGCEFAFIRAHYQSGKDSKFDRNWAETKRVGIPRGAYGWVLPGKNQITEAKKFVSYLGDDFGELAPACDFEKYNGSPSFSELKLFIEQVEILTGKLPYIYTSGGFWTSGAGYKNQTWAAKYPLWHAQYTSAVKPTLKPPFTDWVFWQHSSPGNKRAAEFGAEGNDLDINRFNGDILDFYKFLGEDVVEPGIPDVPNNPDHEVRIARLEGELAVLKEWARGIGYKG